MKEFKELNPRNYDVDMKTECYLLQLFASLMLVQDSFGRDLVITSGLRSQAFQNQLIAEGRSNAPLSKHLLGAAADVADVDGKLAQWCRDNVPFLEANELWCESPSATKGWVHFQTLPPNSGRRFFIP